MDKYMLLHITMPKEQDSQLEESLLSGFEMIDSEEISETHISKWYKYETELKREQLCELVNTLVRHGNIEFQFMYQQKQRKIINNV
ncbi:hypothetical protein JW851_04125 [Candidatus Woesearchaeota archaeon]|nr:hypothetical protein [Candidatus Woesearchaeota archaeon]